MPDPTNTDHDLAAACREWIKGCTCAPAGRPQDCQECTVGFLDAVLRRAQAHGLTIGSNALGSHADPTGAKLQRAGWTPLDSCTVSSISVWEDGEHKPLWQACPMTLGDRVPRMAIETTTGSDPEPAIDVQASEIDNA